MSGASWRRRFVRAVYADHNDAPAVRSTLQPLLAGLVGRGLNVGAGVERLDARLLQLDLVRRPTTDCVGDARRLPFAGLSFDLVVTQETVEHVADPFAAVEEMARVLRPGGRLYLQVPFIIGYHPGPEDYWRFTRAGVSQLMARAGLRAGGPTIVVGGGTGFYRIAVEFAAAVAGRLTSRLYHPIKGLVAVLAYPLKWLDGWIGGGIGADRIPGGYLAVGVKPDDPA